MNYAIITHAVTAMTAVTVGAVQPAPAAVAWSVSPVPAVHGKGQGGGSLQINQTQVAWGALRHKVAAWSYLPADWDGSDGIAPTREATDAAVAFLSRAEAKSLPLPRPFIEGDGEVGFQWKSEKGFGSVAFLSDGNVVGSVPDPQSGGHVAFDLPFGAVRYEGILSALANLV